jgi:hypothetical protein
MPSRPQTFGAIGPAVQVCDGLEQDGELFHLIAEYWRLENVPQLVENEVATLILPGRRQGRDTTEAACARAEVVDEAQGRLANAIINRPAATLVGVAYKLIVWRREAAIMRRGDFDTAHETFTFSAYRDLLRLAGLDALAHPHDEATLTRLKDYWISS